MATTHRTQRTPVKSWQRTSLSPPVWKNQLRERCMERLKQNRQELLAKMRSPGADMAAEIQRIVIHEETKAAGKSRRGRMGGKPRHLLFDGMVAGKEHHNDGKMMDGEQDDNLSIEDLVMMGKLSQQDYLDVVHSLEDALQEEMLEEMESGDDEEKLAEDMMEFEEASLAAMLEGMELEGEKTADDAMEEKHDESADVPQVLCPVCKTEYLGVTPSSSHPVIICSCGFQFPATGEPHSALEAFQQKIAQEFANHRHVCDADPVFEPYCDIDENGFWVDMLLVSCHACRYASLIQ